MSLGLPCGTSQRDSVLLYSQLPYCCCRASGVIGALAAVALIAAGLVYHQRASKAKTEELIGLKYDSAAAEAARPMMGKTGHGRTVEVTAPPTPTPPTLSTPRE